MYPMPAKFCFFGDTFWTMFWMVLVFLQEISCASILPFVYFSEKSNLTLEEQLKKATKENFEKAIKRSNLIN